MAAPEGNPHPIKLSGAAPVKQNLGTTAEDVRTNTMEASNINQTAMASPATESNYLKPNDAVHIMVMHHISGEMEALYNGMSVFPENIEKCQRHIFRLGSDEIDPVEEIGFMLLEEPSEASAIQGDLVTITGFVAVPMPWSATENEVRKNSAFSMSFQVFIFPTTFHQL